MCAMCVCVLLIMVITTCLIIILWYIYIEKSPTFQVFWWNNGDEMMRNKSEKTNKLWNGKKYTEKKELEKGWNRFRIYSIKAI